MMAWLKRALGRCRHRWEYDYDYDAEAGIWRDYRVCKKCGEME